MVRRRGASFEVWVYIGVDAHGRKRYRSETVRGSEDDARRRCAVLLDELDAAPVDVERAGGTVGGLLEEWFVFARPGWSGRTVVVTRSIIDDYVAPGIGSLRLDRLRTSDVDKFYARLAGAGGKAQTLQPRPGWLVESGPHSFTHRAEAVFELAERIRLSCH